MASVVFLRGVNVGGHHAFKPAALARELAALEVVNVGAAGTFVVRKAIAEAKIRAEFLRRLPFEPEIMISSGKDLLALARRDPFRDEPSGKEIRPYVSVIARRPRTLPPLPLSRPPGNDWQVRILDVTGRFVLSLHRRLGRTLVYPNEVVEKSLGVPATTRNWDTIRAICRLLET